MRNHGEKRLPVNSLVKLGQEGLFLLGRELRFVEVWDLFLFAIVIGITLGIGAKWINQFIWICLFVCLFICRIIVTSTKPWFYARCTISRKEFYSSMRSQNCKFISICFQTWKRNKLFYLFAEFVIGNIFCYFLLNLKLKATWGIFKRLVYSFI